MVIFVYMFAHDESIPIFFFITRLVAYYDRIPHIR